MPDVFCQSSLKSLGVSSGDLPIFPGTIPDDEERNVRFEDRDLRRGDLRFPDFRGMRLSLTSSKKTFRLELGGRRCRSRRWTRGAHARRFSKVTRHSWNSFEDGSGGWEGVDFVGLWCQFVLLDRCVYCTRGNTFDHIDHIFFCDIWSCLKCKVCLNNSEPLRDIRRFELKRFVLCLKFCQLVFEYGLCFFKSFCQIGLHTVTFCLHGWPLFKEFIFSFLCFVKFESSPFFTLRDLGCDSFIVFAHWETTWRPLEVFRVIFFR